MDDKQELIDSLDIILSYFEIQSQYGEIEKDIFNYYKNIRAKCNKFKFEDIGIRNWSRAYLEANSDWNNPILGTMNKVDKLIEYFQKNS